MRRLTGRVLGLAALGASLAACASNRYRNPEGQEVTTLVVNNQNWLEHNIYLLYGGQRIRLGTARSETRTRLVIPAQYVFGATSLQFLADPIGSRVEPISDKIVVSPGDEVELTIPPSVTFPTRIQIIGSRPPI